MAWIFLIAAGAMIQFSGGIRRAVMVLSQPIMLTIQPVEVR
jgi:hypothetical protein